MYVFLRNLRPVFHLLLMVSIVGVVGVLAGCEDEEEPEDPSQVEEVAERDRSAEISRPDIVGTMRDDFDPDKKPRIVDPEQWNVTMRTSGMPGVVPTELVAAVDRSIVRRGYPQIGEATVVTVTDEEGNEIDVAKPKLRDHHSLFRIEFEENLRPDTRYEATFESVEFLFGEDEEGREDTELFEFERPLELVFDTPPLELVDVSSARPVGAFGHVELRFSAPVDVDDVRDHLQWSLDDSSPDSISYDSEGDRVISVRLHSSGGLFGYNVSQVQLRGGEDLVSTSGGPPMGAIDESIDADPDSDTLEIRAVGVYERAGVPTVRVLCHDSSVQDRTRSYWDREIRTRLRDVSRRCDVDVERALELVELDVEGDLSVVDHQHGFDLVLDVDGPRGPLGMAFRTGNWGDGVAELFEGREEYLHPSYPGPELAIDADGRYLERSDWSQVPIRHRGVELAHIVVRHAGAEHFDFWLSGSGDDMSSRSSFAIAETYLELDPGPEKVQHSYVDLEQLIGDPQPGAYQVEISAPYRGRLRDSHRFLVSDIQLLAKRASHSEEEIDEVWAWTIDAETAQPVPAVDLELIRENGRVLAECETDDDGFCELSGNWGDLENEPPFAVVAEGSNELAYVDWNDTKTEVVEGQIGGADYASTLPYRGAIRGERTLYRPGETMKFAGFVRGDQYGAEANIPVGIELKDSRGQEEFRTVEETDEVGAIEFEYEIAEMASTGTWEVELFSGDEEIASQQISVESFVPERIEVDIDVAKESVNDGDGLVGDVDAQYFFGTAAAGADFEVQCRFEATQPFENRWPQYEFGPFEDNVDTTTAYYEGTLDDDGRGEFRCGSASVDEQAVYGVEIKASVFEAGSGRPARATGRATLLPGHQLVGLRSPDDRVDSSDGARVEGIVVGPGGDVVTDADAIDLEMGAIRYSTTRVYRAGRTRWERERHESVDSRQQVELDDGRFTMRVAPRGNSVGLYFRAHLNDTVTELEIASPRRYWGWGRQDLDPRPDDPAHIEIEGPDEIGIDEMAQFSFTAPAEGRALVAVETGRVDSWKWIDIEPGENSWEISVEYFDPNVYVSALYIPTGDSAPQGLDRGFGVKRVDISRDRWRADVQLDVPDEREPGETLDIEVLSEMAGADAKVAVSVVDRGILSMAAYDFEDPLAQLFRTKALGVDTFDTVGWYADVSPQRFGGGAMAPPAPAPEAIMPVQPVAMWSGLVDLDDEGRASLEFPIPAFRGELEITAVVVDGGRLGAATERTLIRDPLALQATAPRFATHGDRLWIPVSVTNTTDDLIAVEVRAQALPDFQMFSEDSAELEIVGDDMKSILLAPDERDQVIFEVEVIGRAGVPELLFEASGAGEQSRHVATVPIYPDGPTEVEQKHHPVESSRFDVLAELDGWLPTSETTQLWVTSVPRAPAFEHLEHVLRYPYLRLGTSLYNTVARLRPVIYLDRLLEAADPGASHRGVQWRISWGIRGIERLQRRSGRFGFWPTGTSTVDAWGQAYVLDMLTSAEEAGHNVPDWVMRDGLDWLDRRVQRQQGLEDLDLAMWVLARQGRPNRRAARALLAQLPDNPTGRDHERALLATASLHLAGDETVADELRALIAEPRIDEQTRRYYGHRYSAARHEGLVLEVAIEVFGTEHSLLNDLVENVADRLVDAEVGDLNLHELGWSIAPLGRWAEDRSQNIPTARLYAAGSEIEPDVVADDGSRSWQLHRASEYPEVQLVFDEEPEQAVSVFRRTQGVQADSSAEYGRESLHLRRRFLGADGNQVNLRNIEVGDLVYVELQASHDEVSTLRSLALVDRLPGGFEIEDPRPGENVLPDWFDSSDEWNVDHFDVRDDRLEVFGSIREDQTVKFVYTMRATTAGTYSTPPAELTSMYQRNRWARIAGPTVYISRP